MSIENIIRAWKDDEYRNSLSEAELAQLPTNPADSVELLELSEGETNQVVGGFSVSIRTVGSACRTRSGCIGW